MRSEIDMFLMLREVGMERWVCALYDRCVVGGGWCYVRIQPVKRVPLNCSEDKSDWFWLQSKFDWTLFNMEGIGCEGHPST
jgi:hypothetical protein